MRAPDYEGRHGKVWRVEPMKNPPKVDQTATLRWWMIFAPEVSPAWSYYMVSLIHLRDIPGGEVPVKREYPEAAYEVVVMSFDPNHPLPEPESDFTRYTFKFLQPINHQVAFHGVDDAGAIDLIDKLAMAFADGIMCPEECCRTAVKTSIWKTIEHKLFGGHPQGEA